ncbi:MAG: hypothetical protein KAJ42_02850 [Gemmatimonadetes bacterium]|nr:hypothetical protein [Gemmatimonadota bacterium]
MEEGLVEGLFILIVFVVMIVQSVAAQKKKQRLEAERQRVQGQSGLAEREESADIFTQLARADAEREARDPTTGEADSSEDLIPKEIWEEIGELAGGRRSAEPTPEPAPTSEPTSTWEMGLRTRPTPDRSRKLAAQLGKDATPAPELQLEGAEGEGDVGRLEWLFGGKDPEALRKAILLREVLGPPLALREEEEA